MKILVFNFKDIRHPDAGGAELNIHEQARRWVEWGHQVTIFTARPKGQSHHDNIDGVEIFRAGGKFTDYLWAPFIYLLFLRRRVDVILDIENGIPFFTPFFSLKPKVVLFHHLNQDQFIVEFGPLLGRIGRFLERDLVPITYWPSGFVAVSHSTANRKREALFMGQRLKIDVVHNGLDHSLYSPGGEKFDKPTILYLGRVKTYKRLPVLVSMLPAVCEQVPNVELIIAGTGDAVDQVRVKAERLGLHDRVRFLGPVSEDEKIRLFRGAWVMATPSMNEGWGLTVIEANACGTPAVAFRAPGLEESILHRKSGLLADSEGEFITHLVSILSDKRLRDQLSEGAVDWAAGFDWNNTARRMLEILAESAGAKALSG